MICKLVLECREVLEVSLIRPAYRSLNEKIIRESFKYAASCQANSLIITIDQAEIHQSLIVLFLISLVSTITNMPRGYLI